MDDRRLSMPEFVALMALTFSVLAFSIDSILPAFPAITSELTADAPNRVQLILSAFVLGMGTGTLFTGPLSDAFGRKAVITGGLLVYIAGAALAWHAPTLEGVLAARALQGLGAAAPRVVGTAMVRDLYEGRRMAQITSFVMTVFMLVPAVAPSIGQLVVAGLGWRAMFPTYIGLGLLAGLWLNLRQPETLPPAKRRRFTFRLLRTGMVEVLRNRLVVLYVIVLTFGFAQLFALISSIQPIYDTTFGRAEHFPLYFMAGAAIAASGTIVNATLVMRLGMRQLAITAYLIQTVLAAVVLALFAFDLLPPALAFPVFFVWSTSMFFMNGLTFGNLNALALQPLGHIAGLAASVVAAFSTIGSALLAAPISLAFDGTPVPLMTGALVCSTVAWLLMRRSRDPESALA